MDYYNYVQQYDAIAFSCFVKTKDKLLKVAFILKHSGEPDLCKAVKRCGFAFWSTTAQLEIFAQQITKQQWLFALSRV